MFLALRSCYDEIMETLKVYAQVLGTISAILAMGLILVGAMVGPDKLTLSWSVGVAVASILTAISSGLAALLRNGHKKKDATKGSSELHRIPI